MDTTALVAWRLVDPSSALGGATPDAFGRASIYLDDYQPSHSLTVLAATRTGVLIVDDEAHRLHWGVNHWLTRLQTVAVPEPFYDAAPHAQAVARTLAIELDDGGALVLLTREVYRGGPGESWDTTEGFAPLPETVGVALDLGPDGAVRARRPGAVGPLVAGLARRGDARGFVLRRGDTLTLYPIGGGAPVDLPPLRSLCALPCAGPNSARNPVRWTVALPRGCATLNLPAERAASLTVGAVELEVGAAGACLRALNAVTGAGEPVALVATPAGTLAGERAGRDRLACTPTATLE